MEKITYLVVIFFCMMGGLDAKVVFNAFLGRKMLRKREVAIIHLFCGVIVNVVAGVKLLVRWWYDC